MIADRGLFIMGLELSDEQWKSIDEFIFRGWTINAVKAIREAAGVGIREAVDLAEERRRTLLARTPERFVVDPGYSSFETVSFDTQGPN
jgi:hypothetical protein